MPSYRNPPITEAVLEIRVAKPVALEVGALQGLKDAYRSYPTIKPMANLLTNVDCLSVASETTRSDIGFTFCSADSKQLIQARIDGFAISRLNPYTNWESFSAEARLMWQEYRKLVKPEKIARVALRFINRIDIPLPLKDFKEYLRTLPDVSNEMTSDLSAFLMVLEIPQPDSGLMVRVTEALVPPPNENVASVMLDIDVYQDSNLPQEENAMWELIGKIRLKKNEIFEACLTLSAKELFK